MPSSRSLPHSGSELDLTQQDNVLGQNLLSLVAEENISEIISIIYGTPSPSNEKCMPLATWMTYDISGVAEPPNPKHCFEECRALRRSASHALTPLTGKWH